jgi:predicted dehydrogenase
MNKVKVAIIGAGYMADEHTKAFADVAEVELAGIFSRSRPRAMALAEKHGVKSVCDSIDELHATTAADIVVVAVPELAVAAVCMEVFKYPWMSLIEKPAGYDLADARQIAAAAGSRGRRAFVALNRRHYSSTRAVLDEVRAVDMPRLVNVLDQENPQVALEGGQPPLVVENWMYANSIHIIDYLRLFCRGRAESVDHVVRWQPDDPRFVLARITFSSGDIGVYQATWNGPGPWAVSVTTQARRWDMRPLEQASAQAYKSRKSEPMTTHPWDTRFKPGLRLQAEEALRAWRGEATQLPTLDDGIETMELTRWIYEP